MNSEGGWQKVEADKEHFGFQDAERAPSRGGGSLKGKMLSIG